MVMPAMHLMAEIALTAGIRLMEEMISMAEARQTARMGLTLETIMMAVTRLMAETTMMEEAISMAEIRRTAGMKPIVGMILGAAGGC